MRAVSLGLSVAFCVSASFCFWRRPDFCAAITVWPVMAYVFPGLLLAWLGRGGRKRVALGVVALWVLYLCLFAEEPRSLLRVRRWPTAAWTAAGGRGEGLRVISLNCAGGDEKVAAQVLAYRPDIVLLQESPPREEVEKLAARLFGKEGGVVWGVDASIIARGRVSARALPRELRVFMVQARISMPSGLETEVISTRLVPPIFRVDVFSPDCWREQADNRRARRAQVQEIVRRLEGVPAEVPVIVGGDFNAPAGDGALRPLQPRLHDTFAQGGTGWGNTAINEALVLRIDQVWVSKQFFATAVVARPAPPGDHRMVICDLVGKE
jgi:endonuclease/exonuclease/phosphatase (EEP) superfamily protein YafD